MWNEQQKMFNTLYCKRRKEGLEKKWGLFASIIFKRRIMLYLEKKSDTGFHNHMWKTLKAKLDGNAKAAWGQEVPFFFKATLEHGAGEWRFTQLCNHR